MKILIVYDSAYGNTEKIARAIAGAIPPPNEVKVLRAREAAPSNLASLDLLIVGSPTQAGRPTLAIQEFLSKVPADGLKAVGVASFDTRMKMLLVKLFGNAAGRIADSLKSQGGHLVVAPEGFLVKGREGPLAEGELERAAGWAKGVVTARSSRK